MSEKNETTLIHLTIDGQTVAVPKGTTVYHAAKQLGIEIPIFCYQDRMPPFGACRMCLVEVEKSAKLQTSCTLEATEGMVVKTQSRMAEEGRKSILEFLLINHPLDCPICDRGGECPLQDNTLKYGPGLSRFFEEKRHFKKALPLGSVLMLDRERCIVCARCTRFGEVIAGDNALEFIDRGYKTEVGTPDSKPVESKYIGNTIMICPVGALTSQVYRFRARPWDNDPTNSTCTLCPVGCSMILDSRDGQIMRTRSQENKDVNDIWLCDKGWFGYEFISHPDRLQKPLIRRGHKLETASWKEAISLIAAKIVEALPTGKLAAFGGNPLTTEENYLFQKLMKDVIGVSHVDHRIGTPIIPHDEECLSPGMEISIGECEKLSFACLLGLDLTEEFPVVWLRLKQAINHGGKTLFVGHFAPEISQHLTKTVLHQPGKELEFIRESLPNLLKTYLQEGKTSALFIGSQYLNSPDRVLILSELMKLKSQNPSISLNIMEGRENSLGARIAGMRPDLLPIGRKASKKGLNSLEVMESASKSGWDFIYVAGSNPAAKFPSKLWNEAREKLKFLVVQDLFLTETAMQADVVLPTLSYVEKAGTFINIEGRLQRLRPGKEIPEGLKSDAEIFEAIADSLNARLDMDLDFAELLRQNSIELGKPETIEKTQNRSKDSNNERALLASFAPQLFDNGVRMKHNSHVIELAKKPFLRVNPEDGKKFTLQDNDLVRIKTKACSITGHALLDAGVARGTIVIPLGFDELPVHELGVDLMNGMEIEIQKEV